MSREAGPKTRAELAAELADVQILQGISTQLIHEDRVEALYQRIVDAAVVMMRSDFATMQRLHPDRGPNGALRLLAYSGFSLEVTKAFEWVPANAATTCCAALRTAKRVLVSDFQQCDFMSGTPELDMHLQIGIHAAQSTPLISRNGKTVGMLTTHWRKPHIPSERDIRLLDVLARQAADLIERSQTEVALRKSEEQAHLLAEHLEQAVNERTQELVHAQDRLRDLAAELTLTEHRERKRLATELHDHLQQLLVLGKFKVGQGKRLLPPAPAHAAVLQDIDQMLTDALAYTRTLVTELSPPVLQEHGLSAALRWLGEYMKRHDLTTVVTVPEHDGHHVPEAEALLLFQSVRELLINSAKHAGTHEAYVTLTEDDDTLRIEVQDHGQGFDPSTLASVNPGEPTQTASSKFGLFSIRERMRTLGGIFEIVSKPEGGTTAILVLPISSTGALQVPPVRERQYREASETALQQPLRSHPAKQSMRVLLADDHAMVRQGLRTVLESYNDVEVVGDAADGEEAVKLVDQLQPMVVVMDINMPKMSGIEATLQIRSRHPEIIVVGLSVNAEGENQEAMRRSGAASLLTKEVAVEHLYSAIQHAVMNQPTINAT